MSNNTNRGKKKKRMNTRTKTFVTGAVFVLAILVIILCIMSGALNFKPSSAKATPTPVPSVTAPPVSKAPATASPSPSPSPDQNKTYSVTVFAGHGGSADPQGTSTVKSGKSITVKFTPDKGYAVSKITVNGELVDTADSYTIDKVTSDMTIDVSFDTAAKTTQTPGPIVTAKPAN